MKKYVLPNNVNWYRANMHCHTTISDGYFTPEQIKDEYKKMGYSIVAYTDHEILLDHSDLNDDEFLALTSSEYSINEEEPSIKAPDGFNTNPWQLKKTIHLGVYSKDPHNTIQPAACLDSLGWKKDAYKDVFKGDGYKREYTKVSINETIKRLNEGGFLVSLNHPAWSLNDMNDYLNIKGLWALEILNYATERLTGAEYCPYIYDHMVRNGMYDLYACMGDDNHNRGGSLFQSFGGSTFFGAKELKYEQIIESMEKGEFYCASGVYPPRIESLYVEDNILKVDCTPATDIILTGYGRAYHPIAGVDMTHAEFKLDPNDIMFRLTVRDKFGGNAHTHYYRIDDFYDKELDK